MTGQLAGAGVIANPAVVKALGLDEDAVARALRVYNDTIVVDGSAVVFELGQTLPYRWDRYTAGGVTVTNHTVTMPDCSWIEAVAEITACRRWISDNSDKVTLCTTTSDIHRAKETGIGGIVFGPQDTSFLEKEIGRLDTVYDLGVRVLQLTYQHRNSVGDGCGEPNAGKLSRFGAEVVRRMEELGILVDLSHTSHPTSFDTIDRSTKPVVLSHAHPAALTPHVRAKSDELLKAIAATGGVVGLTSLSNFVKLRDDGSRPVLMDYIKHVDYLVNLLGPDHVGIGMDLDETNTEEEEVAQSGKYPEFREREFSWDDHLVENLEEAVDFPNVALGLVSIGYDNETIAKILGLNFMRVFEQVWKS